MTSTDTTRHIVETYFAATTEEIAAGRAWYDDARALSHDLSRRGKVTPSQAAGVIAALSPMMSWTRNKELAIRAVADGRASGTLGNQVRAANRILEGEPVLDVLKSDKVKNFYLSIMGSPVAVCIDRHAWDVYTGTRNTDKSRPGITPKRYREASQAYVEAAHVLALLPTELQAITWLVWRRMNGVKA